ncbi:uncharacterized protein [Coffea arabica]|uniref:DUF7086 domain-containing protein n=1 Tax=Coffea arabica TaxID=13443 RepID=A0A6P6WVB4_COFAR|nr:uncharacterized protein LOC113735826 [Coffea arabica]XP_027118611.1 uncharacterized protein LOC113735827 [Coffea arabica]
MKNTISSPSFQELNHRGDEDEKLLTLSLFTNPISTAFQPICYSRASPSPSLHIYDNVPMNLQTASHQEGTISTHPQRKRKPPTQTPPPGKSENIPPPYPWATTRRATVHTLDYLLSNGLNRIRGEVQCKRCDEKYEMEFDLQNKFAEIATFIAKNKDSLHDRAPNVWMNPCLPNCKFCDQSNSVKPILTKKRSINWLFLLLGQMLGCCKLGELKYFCKHTKNHRTGAKDRVLYLTYLELCKQLDPQGPFGR